MRGYYLNYRDTALYQAFLKTFEECSPQENAYLKTLNSPAPSFFASERLAITYVHSKENGRTIKLDKLNREKYEEIYRRYLIKREQHPHLSVRDIIYNIIYSPAPRFYIGLKRAKQIINRMRHENYRRKFKKD